MTLKTFNPILGKIFSFVGKLLPDKLKEKNISIPIGLISILAQKNNFLRRFESITPPLWD